MQPIYCGLASLAVANIFYWYRAYIQDLCRRDHLLRERVAYMLWTVANQING